MHLIQIHPEIAMHPNASGCRLSGALIADLDVEVHVDITSSPWSLGCHEVVLETYAVN